MATFTIPALPQILTAKFWQTTKDIPEYLKDDSICEDTLDELAKAYQRANFDKLAPFYKFTPAWSQFNHARWARQCDDLVRDIIVNGVISLREAAGEVRRSVSSAEKQLDKKNPLASKATALLRKMGQAAESLLKELRPEVIEQSIRDKETDVNEAMFAIAGKPLDDMKTLLAKAKAAAAIVMKNTTPEVCNAAIGSGNGGLAREIAAAAAALAALPNAKGIDYDGAGASAGIAKNLASMRPLPPGTDKNGVTAQLKEFLQIVNDVARLPKLKVPA